MRPGRVGIDTPKGKEPRNSRKLASRSLSAALIRSGGIDKMEVSLGRVEWESRTVGGPELPEAERRRDFGE